MPCSSFSSLAGWLDLSLCSLSFCCVSPTSVPLISWFHFLFRLATDTLALHFTAPFCVLCRVGGAESSSVVGIGNRIQPRHRLPHQLLGWISTKEDNLEFFQQKDSCRSWMFCLSGFRAFGLSVSVENECVASGEHQVLLWWRSRHFSGYFNCLEWSSQHS